MDRSPVNVYNESLYGCCRNIKVYYINSNLVELVFWYILFWSVAELGLWF